MKVLLTTSLLLLTAAVARAEKPNILIILADDLGYSDLGCMGGDAETPHLDALAKDGILFPNFYNDAKCAPSRASLMTGQSNHRTGAHHGAGDVTRGGMTLAEALKETHTNLMVDKWHIKPKPLELGFERYFGSPLSAVFWWPVDDKRQSKMQVDGRQYTEADMTVPVEQWYLTVEDTNYAIRFLDEAVVGKWEKKPFFMYYATHAPHWPLQAPRADVDRYLEVFSSGTDVARKRRYERMVDLGIIDPRTSSIPTIGEKTPAWESLSQEEKNYYQLALAIHTAMVYRMDQELGRLFDYLRENKLFDNTAIFFMSDNGASAEGNPTIIPPNRRMGDRGTHSRLNGLGASVCNTPMRGFKSSLYEGGTATPMIFHWPDGIGTPGTISRQVGHLWDIFPTVLDITGLEYPSEYADRELHPLDGQSLLPQIRSGAETERTICWSYEKFSAVRKGKWKAVRQSKNRSEPDGVWQLYNLSEDRNEMNDVSASNPEVVEALGNVWDDWRRDVGPLRKD
ncbi:MAG: arylsulfatase [Pirellulaceae bacterium]|nr:arylsulfatase [Pirellulaceae bacterium]